MREFIIYIAQSGIYLSFFWTVYFFLLRKQTYFSFNRLFLLTGLIISFILPFIEFSYNIIIPAPIGQSIIDSAQTTEIQYKENSTISIWHTLAILYIVGVTILIIRNAFIVFHLRKIEKSGRSIKEYDYTIIDNSNISTPFSAINRIYINSDKLQEKEKNIILKHEISHIKQKHWIDLLCGECALLLQWFNPLMWFYIHSMKENHEYLADKAVLDDGESTTIYRAVLINQRFQGPVFSFANSFSYPNHQNRLTMMTKTKTSPWKKMAALAIIPLVGTFLALSAKPNYVIEDSGSMIIETNDSPSLIDNIPHLADSTINVLSALGIEDARSYVLIIVDGVESSREVAKQLSPEKVDRVEIFRGEGAETTFGEKGKNGVILITTKEGKSLSASNPLIIIDGVESTKENMEKLAPTKIESMSVWKGEEAVRKYGEKAKDGAIEIITKNKGNKDSSDTQPSKPIQVIKIDSDKINQDVAKALKDADIDQQVVEALRNADIDNKVAEALKEANIDSKVAQALKEVDIAAQIEEALKAIDTDKITEEAQKATEGQNK